MPSFYCPGTYTVAEAEVAATIEPKISAEAASARIPVSIRLTAGNFVRDRG